MNAQAQVQTHEPDNVSKFTKADERNLTGEINNIKKDMAGLREDLAKLTRLLTDQGISEVSKMRENLAQGGRKLWENTEELTKKGQERAEQTIRDKPLLYVCSAFGLGVLASKLLTKRFW